MYVHRALSCHCRQQVWILTPPPLTRIAPLMQDSRAKAEGSTKTEKARLLTVSCLNNSVHRGVYNHSLVLKTSICSLSLQLSSLTGSKSSRQVRRQSVHKISRCILPIAFHVVIELLLCHCCHDPFIGRSAQTRPPFTGFTQLAHPVSDVHHQR